MIPTSDLNASKVSPEAFIRRKKVELKPGRSLMDWIRFSHSAIDLSSTGGKCLEISPRELSKHNKKEDAWICLKGKVYNITPYLEYHPGGEDELMRGAGKDATDLFNQIHRWVNFESMLQKCFVGVLRKTWFLCDSLTLSKSPGLKEKKANKFIKPSTIGSAQSLCVTDANDSKKNRSQGAEIDNKIPRLDWSETEENLRLIIYTDDLNLRQHDLITSLTDDVLLITLYNGSPDQELEIKLLHPVSKSYEVKIEKEKKAIDILLLKESKRFWMEEGKPIVQWKTNKGFEKGTTYWPCKLVSKTSVNYNTFLFGFEFPTSVRMWVPLGHHISIKSCIDGTDVVRSYTPVVSSLNVSPDETILTDGCSVTLMIKIYPSGALTPVIDSCKVGDNMFLSSYLGNFSPETMLEDCDSLVMLAAGTGITPMIKIIYWSTRLLSENERSVLLIFFNKTEQDILWQEEFADLSVCCKNFKVIHVLSEADEKWEGIRGNISKQLIGELLPIKDSIIKERFFICGPIPFSESAVKFLEDEGHKQNELHVFSG